MTKKMYLVLLVCSLMLSEVTGSSLKQQKDVTQDVTRNSENVIANNNDSQNISATVHHGPRPDLKQRLPFAGSGCSCNSGKCSCCASIYVQSLDYDRKACAVMSLSPSQFLNFEVIVNTSNPTNGTFRGSFSTKSNEPKQYCAPILPYSPLGPVDLCVRLFGLTFAENKLHLCMNMMTRVSEQAVFHVKLDCMDMDIDPTNTNPSVDTTSFKPVQPDSDVYDLVIPETTSASTLR